MGKNQKFIVTLILIWYNFCFSLQTPTIEKSLQLLHDHIILAYRQSDRMIKSRTGKMFHGLSFCADSHLDKYTRHVYHKFLAAKQIDWLGNLKIET